jgi:hypothetical protein
MKTIRLKIVYPEYEDKIVCDCGGKLHISYEITMTFPSIFTYYCTICGKSFESKEKLNIL